MSLRQTLDTLSQARCDAMADRLARVSAALEDAARSDDQPYDAPLNFVKLFTIMEAIAGGDLSGRSVLDVGCGGGGFMAQALALGMQPTGIDIYSGQAHGRAVAERVLQAAGMPQHEVADHVIDASITAPLNGLADRFDFVISVGMLEHVPEASDRIAAVSNMIRALAPGGTMLLECAPNARFPLDLFHYGPRYPFYHQLPIRVKRTYMDRVIKPRRPDLNEVQSAPNFLTGVSVSEIHQAVRDVDPNADVVQGFPFFTQLSVTTSALRRPYVQALATGVGRALTAVRMEPVVYTLARRSAT